MGQYADDIADDIWEILLNSKALAKAKLAQREEEWLFMQASLLQERGGERLQHFAELLMYALADINNPPDRRRKQLHILDDFVQRSPSGRDFDWQEKQRGGYGGHLPNQLKKRPKLRLAIWNLYVRAYGPNSFMGRTFALKTSEDFAELRKPLPGGRPLPNIGKPRPFSAQGHRP
jgi:hypothetical protein